MKATNIRWDVTDGTETMSQEEVNEILGALSTEVEIPNNLTQGYEDDAFDYYYPDISDWLSNEFGFCHYGFQIEK